MIFFRLWLDIEFETSKYLKIFFSLCEWLCMGSFLYTKFCIHIIYHQVLIVIHVGLWWKSCSICCAISRRLGRFDIHLGLIFKMILMKMIFIYGSRCILLANKILHFSLDVGLFENLELVKLFYELHIYWNIGFRDINYESNSQAMLIFIKGMILPIH